jgi:hypothetical protein
MNLLNQHAKDGLGADPTSRPAWRVYVILLFAVAFTSGGCVEPYAARPYSGVAYAPAVAPVSTAVSIEVGDRPYYTRGPGYYVGRAYYVWRPGHWSRRYGHRVWIHGHYVLRG